MYSEQNTLNAHNTLLEGATQLKQAPLDFSFRSLLEWHTFLTTFFRLPRIKPWVIVHGFGQNLKILTFQKMISSERASQEEQNGANFSCIALSVRSYEGREKSRQLLQYCIRQLNHLTVSLQFSRSLVSLHRYVDVQRTHRSLEQQLRISVPRPKPTMRWTNGKGVHDSFANNCASPA